MISQKQFIKALFFFLSAACAYQQTYAIEFLYPVAAVTYPSPKIYLLYQKNPDHLEIFTLDPETKIASKALLSTFTPAGFQILPDNSGFSFIDKGRIKVRSFAKRSPKSITLCEPIEDLTTIHWLADANTFYFMGRWGKNFCIMQATQQGAVDALVQQDGVDYMYPQKIDDQLFFIERTSDHHYYLAQTTYPTSPRMVPCKEAPVSFEHTVLLNHESQPVRSFVCSGEIKQCIDFGHHPAAFLHMVSETEGYYLEHPSVIDRSDVLIPFTYYMVKKENDIWNHQPLFEFKLPAHFVLNSSDYRLYESLLPLLPRHQDNSIYFIHCNDPFSLKTGIYSFDLKNKAIQQLSKLTKDDPAGTAYFAPVTVGKFTFYGGTLPSEMCLKPSITAWLNEDGLTCIELPSFVRMTDEEQDAILEEIAKH